jgi:hypothetical protein
LKKKKKKSWFSYNEDVFPYAVNSKQRRLNLDLNVDIAFFKIVLEINDLNLSPINNLIYFPD